MKLIITEKPSLARAIAKALGIKGGNKDGYITDGKEWYITWVFGHLFRLQYPNEIKEEWKKWRKDNLPMFVDFTTKHYVLDNSSSSVIKGSKGGKRNNGKLLKI